MYISCYDYALKYLSRYQKTTHGLIMQLKKKGYEEEERGETIEKLKELGMLDDIKYAEQYLFSEVVRKGKPLFIIQQKLWQKGVDKENISILVEDMEEELTRGQKTKIEKEIDKLQEKGVDKHEIFKKLQSRGYGYRLIQEVRDVLALD